MGTMAIPDHTGHTVVAWHTDDPVTIGRARDHFGSLRAERLVPFGRRGSAEFEQLREFDVDADEIMWVRPLQGG